MGGQGYTDMLLEEDDILYSEDESEDACDEPKALVATQKGPRKD